MVPALLYSLELVNMLHCWVYTLKPQWINVLPSTHTKVVLRVPG